MIASDSTTWPTCDDSYYTTMIEINNRKPKRLMIKALLKRKHNTIQPEREFHFKYK